jgi:ribosome-associated protein
VLLPEVLRFDTYPGGLHQLCSPSEHSDGLTGAQNITHARVFVASSATRSRHPFETMEDPMPIGRHAAIPLREITLRASRSSGPGGQHANVTASRIEAVFDVAASTALTDEQKRRVIARLGPRVVAVAQDERSQTRNRELALQRLQRRLTAALRVARPRHETKPTRASVQRRLDSKRRQSARKRDRRHPGADD